MYDFTELGSKVPLAAAIVSAVTAAGAVTAVAPAIWLFVTLGAKLVCAVLIPCAVTVGRAPMPATGAIWLAVSPNVVPVLAALIVFAVTLSGAATLFTDDIWLAVSPNVVPVLAATTLSAATLSGVATAAAAVVFGSTYLDEVVLVVSYAPGRLFRSVSIPAVAVAVLGAARLPAAIAASVDSLSCPATIVPLYG